MSKIQEFYASDILFDMETQDPDDIFTLCFLLGHPRLTLRAVTINPGSLEQVGLVRGVLEKLGRITVTVDHERFFQTLVMH